MNAAVQSMKSSHDICQLDTRMTVIEKAIVNLDKQFTKTDDRLKSIDAKIEIKGDNIEKRLDLKFTLLISLICGLYVTTIGSLITVIVKMHLS